MNAQPQYSQPDPRLVSWLEDVCRTCERQMRAGDFSLIARLAAPFKSYLTEAYLKSGPRYSPALWRALHPQGWQALEAAFQNFQILEAGQPAPSAPPAPDYSQVQTPSDHARYLAGAAQHQQALAEARTSEDMAALTLPDLAEIARQLTAQLQMLKGAPLNGNRPLSIGELERRAAALQTEIARRQQGGAA